MDEKFNSISKALNTDTDIVEVEKEVTEIKTLSKNHMILQKIMNIVDANLYSLIEKGQGSN